MKRKRGALDLLRQSATQPGGIELPFIATVFLIGKGELKRAVVSFPSHGKDPVVNISTAHRVALEKWDMGPASSIILAGDAVYYVQQEGKHYNVFLVKG